jgi:hypothetical protein
VRAAWLNKHKPDLSANKAVRFGSLKTRITSWEGNAKQLNAIRTNVEWLSVIGTERVSRKSQNRSNGYTGKKLERWIWKGGGLKNENQKNAMSSCTDVMIRRLLCCWVILIDTLLDSRQEGDSLNESFYNSQRHIKRYSGE